MTDPEAVVVTAGLCFARVAALVATLPVWSATGMPRATGVLVSLGATLLVLPGVPVVTVQGAAVIPGLIGEVGAGWLLGLGVMATFHAAGVAAEVVSSQAGLNLGQIADPVQQNQQSPLGVLMALASASAFVQMGLHDTCLEAVAASFAVAAPGTWGLSSHVDVAQALAGCLGLGLQLGGPLLAFVWAIHLCVALLGRLAPRMNAFFAIGNTLVVVAGLVMMGVSLPWIGSVHGAALREQVATLFPIAGP